MLLPRIAAVIGADCMLAAFTILAEWRDPARPFPKDRDFALGLGPVVVTAEALDPGACVQVVRVDGAERARLAATVFDWEAALASAALGTRLFPGDLLAGPTYGVVEGIAAGSAAEIEVAEIGTLEQQVAG